MLLNFCRVSPSSMNLSTNIQVKVNTNFEFSLMDFLAYLVFALFFPNVELLCHQVSLMVIMQGLLIRSGLFFGCVFILISILFIISPAL